MASWKIRDEISPHSPFESGYRRIEACLHVQQFCIVVLHRLGLERPLGEHLVTHVGGEGMRDEGCLWNEAY